MSSICAKCFWAVCFNFHSFTDGDTEMPEHFVVEPWFRHPVTGLFKTRMPECCRALLFCFCFKFIVFLSLHLHLSPPPVLCWVPPHHLSVSDFCLFCFAFILFQRILASSEVENWEFIHKFRDFIKDFRITILHWLVSKNFSFWIVI